jgi:ankyrin repeat protein
VEVVCELVNAGAALDSPDIGLWTPLIWACYRGHADTVAELVSRGADVNTRGVHQVPGLVWAAGRGHIDVVRLLLGKIEYTVHLNGWELGSAGALELEEAITASAITPLLP